MKSLLLPQRQITLFLFLNFFIFFSSYAQHTFSIVAIDPATGQIGSAGATCLDSVDLNGEEGALVISDIILGKGAIHTQAAWSPTNQNAARNRMLNHNETPQQIIDWLVANDPASGSINSRQYNIVSLNGQSAGYTGSSAHNEKGHRIGTNYAIAGNILISTQVLDDMEAAFLNTSGDLATKLMAVMQAAKRPGADARCTSEGVSSRSAFIRVAQPSDTDSSYGNLWLDINISATPFGVEPIDELQTAYDAFIATLSTREISDNPVTIFPNPAKNILNISNIAKTSINTLEIYTITGKKVFSTSIFANKKLNSIDLSTLSNGLYLVKFMQKNTTAHVEKLIINKQF